MRYKQILVRELGIEEGFAFYRDAFGFPDSDRLTKRSMASLYVFAKKNGAAFHETDPGGEPLTLPPHVVRDGSPCAPESIPSAIFVACLIDARVRARSGFIEARDVALLDYPGDELACIDDELDIDPAVFHAEDGAVWMIGPEDEERTVELDEAVTLLGPQSDDFENWIMDMLPRYIGASKSGGLPPVPVLIDQSMPPRQRESLQQTLALGTEIIDLPSFATARVRRLWCASNRMHMPLLPVGAAASNILSYWDKPDLTPVQATLDDWQTHFPDFTIYGDPEVEPIIAELFPQYLPLFRSIRIPTCKSDLALLLLLYEHGGLYIDCHCGVRDPDAIRRLMSSLHSWEFILYDKNRGDTPRSDSELCPLNSVLFARRHSPIILAAATSAFTNLAEHWSAEQKNGFQPYHIGALSGPEVLGEVLLADLNSPVSMLKPEWQGRVLFLQEGEGEPIGRYMHYGYRVTGMHWSERQQHELLFDDPSVKPAAQEFRE